VFIRDCGENATQLRRQWRPATCTAAAISIAHGSVVAPYKPIAASAEDIDLMQAPRGAAVHAAAVAGQILKMQDDLSGVVAVAGEIMQGFRRAAPASYRGTNFGRQIVDVLRIVWLLSEKRAALRRQLNACRQHGHKRAEASHDDHGVPRYRIEMSRPPLTPNDCSWPPPNE